MKQILFILIVFLSFGSYAQSSFYVSPSGKDRNQGTREKPFKTILRAQKAVQEFLKNGQNRDITVWIDKGTYYLTEPVKFGTEFTGDNGFQVRFRALGTEKPVISGGQEINHWEKYKNGIWVAKVHGPGETGFRELFYEGHRATRARHPNSGFLRVASVGADHRTNFTFNTGDFPRPDDPSKVEIVMLHDWSISRIPVASMDDGEKRITATDSIGAKSIDFFNLDNWESHPRYFLENSMAFLDSAYEWYYNPDARLLYLKLPEDQNPGDGKVIIPVTGPYLVEITGTSRQKVKNISFEGISFQHSRWILPDNKYAGIQACFYDQLHNNGFTSVVPPAINCNWAENCSFVNCDFQHFGGSGLSFASGCKGCKVERSLFSDISGNGIMIGEGSNRTENKVVWWKSVPEQVATGNQVTGCTVTQCGKQFFGAVGIWCGFTAGTVICGNQIYDLPYSGISAGWEWSPAPTPCRDNHLTGNHIHHVMQLLSDGGGIYMLGLQPGSTITGNLIHDVSINAGRAESNGMFLDEGTTDVEISGNIIYHIACSPLRFHRATVNLVKENVLSCGNEVPPIRYNRTSEEDIRQVNNRIFSDMNPEDQKVLNELISQWLKR